jgi:minimal PKS chain-length factor (CLF/KS beta)
MTRAIVTGIGVVAPSGVGTTAHWSATLAGRQCVTPVDDFDVSGYATRLAGQVTSFRASDYLDDRIVVQTDRWSWFSLVSAQLALQDATYDPHAHEPYQTGVVLASGSGGNEFGQREIANLWRRGRTAVSAYQSIAWFYAASTGQISIRHHTKGPSGVVVSEAAGGLDSLAQARRLILRGTGAVLAGGTEAGVAPYALACQMTSGRLTLATTPSQGYKPFDKAANGYAPGEGGAILLVENAERATARQSPPPPAYGEIIGYGSTHDGHHHSDAPPNSRYYALAMRRALDDAGLTPDDIDVVYADGAGSPDLDGLEIRAMQEVFACRRAGIPVTAPQGLIGRLSAGGSALNVANALLSIRDSIVPAIGNLDSPHASRGIDFVRTPRDMQVRVAMVNARGYGGFNSSLIVRSSA